MPSPADRAVWLQVAREWLKLAEAADATATNANAEAKKGMKWKTNEDAQLRTLKAKGLSYAQIAEQLGRTENSVRSRLSLLEKQDAPAAPPE